MINPLTYFEAFIVIVASAYTGFIYGLMLESRTIKKVDDAKPKEQVELTRKSSDTAMELNIN